MKLCIDAGHGGSDPGGVGRDPFLLAEKTLTLNLARLVEAELTRRGHRVVMTRRRDRTLGLSARAAFANRLAADVFVSIHTNAAPKPDVEGMEVFHFPGSRPGRTLAQSVLVRMLETFPAHRNRGVKSANFVVLRETRMPAILVECEFLTNPRQLRFLGRRANQVRLARAIAVGLTSSRARSDRQNPA